MALCLIAPAMCAAQSGGSTQNGRPTVVSERPPKALPPSNVKVPLLDQAPRLSEFAGGEDGMDPVPALAKQMGHIIGFIQTSPVDGKVPSNATEVWIGRTHTAVYFVFLCHDSRPTAIRSHLARRENINTDDTVSVLLDPFQDHRLGTLFSVNPAGVQGDAAWSENSNPDYSYDQVWNSEARITRGGWAALIEIPYLSLRFRPGSPDWGVVFQRSIPRNSEADFWPRIAASISGVLPQEGTLTGMSDAPHAHNFQLNPYALAQNEHSLKTLYPLDPYFSSRKLEGTAGGDAKLVIKDSIVLDATVNPDFSQIESDQPQFTVNQRYPVYFPELRPFFLENASYFSTPIDLLYTRTIVHPEFGLRATGKIGHTNIGLLTIDDRQPGAAYSPGDPLHGQHALFGVGRVSRNFGEGSSVGLIYTDEEFGGSWNRIGGVDFTARFNSHWTARGQAVESSTRGVDRAGERPGYSAGPASYLEFSRNGHAFNMDNTFQDYSTGFVTQPGFIATADIIQDSNSTHYQWFPKHGPLQTYGIESQEQIAFDHQGNRVSDQAQTDVFVALARGIVLAPIGGQSSSTLTPAEYPVLAANRTLTQNFGGIIARGAPLAQFNYNIIGLLGGNVNYNPPNGAKPFLLHQDYLQALISFQPLRPLTLDNTYLLDRDRSAVNNNFVFENQTLRTKINYQFTRAFSARVIVEYDSTLVNPAETSLVSEFTARKNISLETLARQPNTLWTPGECPLCAAGMALDDPAEFRAKLLST